MTDQSLPLFAFDEADHLTRIHLKLALEDVGFAVRERGDTVAIVPDAMILPRQGEVAAVRQTEGADTKQACRLPPPPSG